MGQIDRVDEVRSRRYKRMAIAEVEDVQCYGECRVYGPDGVTLIRTIPPAVLMKRDLGNGQEAPKTSRAAEPKATVSPSPSAWRRAKSHRKRTAA